MNRTTATSTRPRPALRWVLPLLLALGLLGLSPARAEAVPLTGATAVDGLRNTTCVVTNAAQARCWGEGNQGQLGTGVFGDSGVANPVKGVGGEGVLTGVTAVSAGLNHACAVLETGRAVCWGDDALGQLGNGAGDQDSSTPVFVRNAADTAPLSGVAQVSAGNSFTCVRLVSGQARCWGSDSDGQVGDGGPFNVEHPLPRVVSGTNGQGALGGITQLSTGGDHACARLNTGQVRCWGRNTAGQLGDTTNEKRAFPVVVRNTSGTAALADVSQVAAGTSHTCARMANGTARCWGEGNQGQLGNNDDLDRDRPVGVRAPTGSALLSNVSQVTVGASHTCFRLANGQARCTGQGVSGQLGNPNFSDGPVLRPVVVRNPADTGALTGVAQLSAGDSATCARLSNGQGRCWGEDGSHALGNGAAGSSDLPTVVEMP
ncbi:MAG TPA: hypothetical protein VD926_10800 [Acidimicrobiales bacterium]|nr:hypothetical protein [Acidimicrobiales bacterium]